MASNASSSSSTPSLSSPEERLRMLDSVLQNITQHGEGEGMGLESLVCIIQPLIQDTLVIFDGERTVQAITPEGLPKYKQAQQHWTIDEVIQNNPHKTWIVNGIWICKPETVAFLTDLPLEEVNHM